MSLIERFLRMMMPQACVQCGGTLHGDETVCKTCLRRLREREIDRLFRLKTSKITVEFRCKASGLYDDFLRKSIQRLKFSGKTIYAKGLGTLMTKSLNTVPVDFDLVTYVPSTAQRLKNKGYDHARLLAAEVAIKKQLPLITLLEKLEETQPQHMLSGQARRENLKGKFGGSSECKGKRILLVDDVVTTGSTICECAAELYRQGAKLVYGICAASSGYQA